MSDNVIKEETLSIEGLKRSATKGHESRSKLLAPETVGVMLSKARDGANAIALGINQWERLSDKELVNISGDLFLLDAQTASSFLFEAPDGKPHEPQVLEYRRWIDLNGMAVMKEFSAISRGISEDGFERFSAIVARLPQVIIEQRAIATNAAKGGNRKAEKSGHRVAKDAAMLLWPEANRKGWTAERFWTALTDVGHKVKADTARKWLTKLRNTGAC